MSVGREFDRGSVWGLEYPGVDGIKPVVVVSNDARNQSRFEWVHVVRITTRDKPPLPTIVPLAPEDQPLVGRAMCDEVELVPKTDLIDGPEFAHRLSQTTMREISRGLRMVLDLTGP